MESIPDDLLIINAADPAALTRLLDLPELAVTRLERPAWLGRIILQCHVTNPAAACPDCGQVSAAVHQRFWCAACQRPFSELLAAIAPYARTTRRFATSLVSSVRMSTVAATARASRHGYKAVEGLFYRHAAASYPEAPPTGLPRRLGIDEIAGRKGHGHFQLILTDLDAGRVIAHLPDRQQETLRTYLASWRPEQRAAVQEVATDFWAAYHTVAAELLPGARVVGDRFHVQQHLSAAVNATRGAVQRKLGRANREFVRRWRNVLLRNEEELSPAEWVSLEVLKQGLPELRVVHTLKEEFRALFNAPLGRAEAAEQLLAWLERARGSGIAPLREFADFVWRWREPILNYFVARTTSGVVEGLNNKIKLILRRAFGFSNHEHFRLRVLMGCDGSD
jgi:transposase